MKKCIILLMALALCLCAAAPAFAADAPKPRIVDDADILSQSEVRELEKLLEEQFQLLLILQLLLLIYLLWHKMRQLKQLIIKI